MKTARKGTRESEKRRRVRTRKTPEWFSHSLTQTPRGKVIVPEEDFEWTGPARRPPSCTCVIQPGGARTRTRPFSSTSRAHDLFCVKADWKPEQREKTPRRSCESERGNIKGIYIWRYSGSPRADSGRSPDPICSVAPKVLAWPLSLRIEPAQVFYVPRIRKLLPVLRETDASRPGDCYDGVGALPAGG